MTRLVISPQKVASILIIIVLVLCGLSLISGHYRLKDAILFNVGAELNIPTWFSSMLLLLCAGLLSVIASTERKAGNRYALHWSLLSAVFLLLSIDEVAALHERSGAWMQAIFPNCFLHTAAWTAPVAVLVALLGISYTGFIIHLPTKTRTLFVLAGILYIGGAMGLELVGAVWRVAHGEGNRTYTILMTLEECLGEMGGLVVFIYALCGYISSRMGPIELLFETPYGKHKE